MAAVAVGRVRTRAGSVTVRAVYAAGLVNLSGTPFQVGEAISWSGGSGVVASWDAVDEEIGFVRTSGSAPAVGATLTGGTSGATGDIDGFGAGSPPGWDTSVTAGDFFRVSGGGAEHQVAGGVLADALDLVAAFPDDFDSVKYAVQTDTSTNRGYPLVEIGDPNPITPLRRFTTKVDADVERALAPPVENVAADHVLDAVDDRNLVLVVDASGAPRTVTLPDAATAGAGWRVTMIASDVSGGNVTLVPSGADTLHGGGTLSSQDARLAVIRDAAGDWRRID